MPNHYYSELSVDGPTQHMREFLRLVEDEPFSLQKFIPMPPSLDAEFEVDGVTHGIQSTREPVVTEARMQNKLLHGYEWWYPWRLHNWGAKWDVYDHGPATIEPDRSYFCTFFSAWSPPLAGLEKISKMHPYLLFKLWGYDEFESPTTDETVLMVLHNGRTHGKLIAPGGDYA